LSLQDAILMMLLPPGLLQIPSIDKEAGAAVWAAIAATNKSAGIPPSFEVSRLVPAGGD
jgi:hypothetical protein